MRHDSWGAGIEAVMWFLGRREVVALALGALVLGSGCSRNGSGMLAVGSPAPSLRAFDQHGKERVLDDYKGSVTVVYFYPKDATPGCTEQACAFRDVWSDYEAAGVAVLGVSTDDRASKASFAKEHRLPFPILADPEGRWVEAFGVPTTMGMASRVTFLLASDGTVAKTYPDVDPGVHAATVLEDARGLAK